MFEAELYKKRHQFKVGRGCDVSGRPQTERTRIIVFCVDICCVFTARCNQKGHFITLKPKGHAAAAVEKPGCLRHGAALDKFLCFLLFVNLRPIPTARTRCAPREFRAKCTIVWLLNFSSSLWIFPFAPP